MREVSLCVARDRDGNGDYHPSPKFVTGTDVIKADDYNVLRVILPRLFVMYCT